MSTVHIKAICTRTYAQLSTMLNCIDWHTEKNKLKIQCALLLYTICLLYSHRVLLWVCLMCYTNWMLERGRLNMREEGINVDTLKPSLSVIKRWLKGNVSCSKTIFHKDLNICPINRENAINISNFIKHFPLSNLTYYYS